MKQSDLVGHEQIAEHLTRAVSADKISHAYVFYGEKGMGKSFLARYFAKLLQCEAPLAQEGDVARLCACGKCKSCIQMDGGNQPDVVFVTHEKSTIGVDDIRSQVNADIQIKPYSSKYKIYIIDDADKMTEVAQNALLKTIEEPPEYGIIILLADNVGRLLPTIMSRCVALAVKPVAKKQIKEYLQEVLNVPEIQAEMAATFSAGNIGKATRYAMSEDFAGIKSDVLDFLRHMNEMQLPTLIDTVKTMGGYKSEIKDCIDLMILWFRDVLMLKATNDPNSLIFKEEYKILSTQAQNRDYASIEKAIGTMEKTKVRLDANVNFDTAIELMLLDMLGK